MVESDLGTHVTLENITEGWSKFAYNVAVLALSYRIFIGCLRRIRAARIRGSFFGSSEAKVDAKSF